MDMSRFQEKTYQTPKGVIHYWLSRADAEGPELVFLPGLTADHRLFERQLDNFAQKYTVLVWDAPGHFMSRPFVLDFDLMHKAVWLHDILSAEGLERLVLIGQSMGGYVSQCFMQRFPGAAKGFVSIDSAPIKRKYMTAAEIWLLKKAGAMYAVYPWPALQRDGARGCAETEYGRALMADMMRSYSKAEYVALAGFGYKILADAVEADLPYEIACPALLLCGELDKAGSTKRYNLAWTREEGIPLKLIPSSGHNSNTDDPDTVNRLIEQFVRQLRQ